MLAASLTFVASLTLHASAIWSPSSVVCVLPMEVCLEVLGWIHNLHGRWLAGCEKDCCQAKLNPYRDDLKFFTAWQKFLPALAQFIYSWPKGCRMGAPPWNGRVRDPLSSEVHHPRHDRTQEEKSCPHRNSFIGKFPRADSSYLSVWILNNVLS